MLIGTTRDELSLLEIPFLRRHWKLDHIISDGLSREADATRKSIRLLYEREYRKREARIQLLSDMIFRSAALFTQKPPPLPARCGSTALTYGR